MSLSASPFRDIAVSNHFESTIVFFSSWLLKRLSKDHYSFLLATAWNSMFLDLPTALKLMCRAGKLWGNHCIFFFPQSFFCSLHWRRQKHLLYLAPMCPPGAELPQGCWQEEQDTRGVTSSRKSSLKFVSVYSVALDWEDGTICILLSYAK